MKNKKIYIIAASDISVERIKYYLCLKKYLIVSGSSNKFDIASQDIFESTPDILLIDDDQFESDELEKFIQGISNTFSEIKIVLFTGTLEICYLKHLIEIGVPHIVHKQSREQINDALKFALFGVHYASPAS